MSDSKKMKKLFVRLALALSFSIIIPIFLIRTFQFFVQPGSNRMNVYSQLHAGMGAGKIVELFKRHPDATIDLNHFRIWYYFGDSRRSFKAENMPEISAVDSPNELPDTYDAIQLAIDRDTNALRAWTWIGEEYDVHSDIGAYPGSQLTDLPATFWLPAVSPNSSTATTPSFP